MADVTSDKLPLPFTRLISEQPAANVLPLPFTRLIGSQPDGGSGGSGGNGDDNGNNDDVNNPPLKIADVAGCMMFTRQSAVNVSLCRQQMRRGSLKSNCYSAMRDDVETLRNCYQTWLRGFVAINNCSSTSRTDTVTLKQCGSIASSACYLIRQCAHEPITPTVNYKSCVRVDSLATAFLHSCNTPVLTPIINYKSCTSHGVAGHLMHACISEHVQKAVPVPCRYYPIPEPPPPPPVDDYACGIRPRGDKIPLYFTRPKVGHSSAEIPLPFACKWAHEIPNLRTYIMHNKISATIDGVDVDPISFDISTSMDNYCWQGSIDIGVDDFRRVNFDKPRGQEPVIEMTINNHQFVIIGEEPRRSRQFINHTHSIPGRSITARLGADYAKTRNELLNQQNYASQIANQQLANLPITITKWLISDWLIPADAYATTGKTPIAVISDIASAAGGFVESHRYEPHLFVKKRWAKPAWELATATPDVTVPAGIIVQIDDQRRVSPRANNVFLTSATQAGQVYRQRESRDLDASAQEHPLYTDRDAIIQAGIAVLSETGIHADYTIKLPWSEQHGIPLAELGQIWQIDDPEGAWRGVVKAIRVSVSLENDAPAVWQTVTIDRYLDV